MRLAERRSPKRGLVLLYSITVFAVIAAIGLTLLESGEAFVGTGKADLQAVIAQQAAFSGLAYGESLLQGMMNLASRGAWTRSGSGRQWVGPPSWAGRKPITGQPYFYVPLMGARDGAGNTLAPGNPGNPNAFPCAGCPIGPNLNAVSYTWTVDARGGAEVERALFRIELRECSKPFAVGSLAYPQGSAPNPTVVPGCGDLLFDENLMRQDFLFSTGSPYKPTANVQAFGLNPAAVSDLAFFYTLRVEGEAQFKDPATGAFVAAARVVVKEPFTFKDNQPTRLIEPQAFWFQDMTRGF